MHGFQDHNAQNLPKRVGKKTHTHNNKIQNILPWNEVFWQEYGSLLWHSNCELIIITKDDMGSVNFA